MSHIIHYLKCEHCNTQYDNIYISFGHNEKCFDWKWKCEECNHENTYHVWSYYGNWCNTCKERMGKGWESVNLKSTKTVEEIMNEYRCSNKFDYLIKEIKNKFQA